VLTIDERLVELGIELPDTSLPPNEHANELYDAHVLPSYQVGDILFLAGQVPMRGKEELYKGRYGDNLTAEDGYRAARLCAVNALGDMKYALGSLDRVLHIVRMIAFINATPAFTQHPQVANGASDLFIQVFGDRGRHARAAIGVTGMAAGHSIETLITVHVGNRDV
jgi:enamine deaminase RidA (YjgF/YER057c/UK114 family)